eukprot:3676353-Pleurochrysis_carterae.AAC.1
MDNSLCKYQGMNLKSALRFRLFPHNLLSFMLLTCLVSRRAHDNHLDRAQLDKLFNIDVSRDMYLDSMARYESRHCTRDDGIFIHEPGGYLRT